MLQKWVQWVLGKVSTHSLSHTLRCLLFFNLYIENSISKESTYKPHYIDLLTFSEIRKKLLMSTAILMGKSVQTTIRM